MATIRLTKAQFEEASRKMADIAFEAKINKQNEKIRAFGDSMANKYIPSSVIECLQQYKKWFFEHKKIGLYYYTGNFNSYTIYIGTNLNVTEKSIEVTQEEYSKAETLTRDYDKLVVQKTKYREELLNALCNLRTVKNIQKELPEALTFISITASDANLPAIQYNTLREVFNNAQGGNK